MSAAEKKIAIRLAKQERRTLSGFIKNLIHERRDYFARLDAAITPIPVPVNVERREIEVEA
jgi:hypothetical protein